MPKISKCCVPWCHESSRNLIEEISFHREVTENKYSFSIPKDELQRQIWIDIIEAGTNSVTKQSNVFPIEAMVCSKHFPKTSFVDRVNGSRFLKKNCFPSIFPNPQRESSKTVWSDSDNDDDDNGHTDPLDNQPPDDNEVTYEVTYEVTSASEELLQSFDDKNNIAEIQTVTDAGDNTITHCVTESFSSDDKDNLFKNIKNFRKNCRFCLTIPKSTQISKFSSQDIAKMYESLTGMDFNYNPHHLPDVICTTCSYKLKSAFEFREYLVEINHRWETLLLKDREDAKQLQDSHPIEPPPLVEPKLEVILIEDSNEYPEFETFEEYLDDEFVDDDKDDTPESDEDEKFITKVQEFIKSVKPSESIETFRKPNQKFFQTQNTIPNTERLNFRSTSSPHSLQKLKKDKNWWRMMHDCNYCGAKDFLRIDDLKKHLKEHHPERIKVTCDICQKDYSEMIYLRKHMKYVHQTKKHECTHCRKKFYYNYNLKSHMLTHTNAKTSICHLCGKLFTPTALHAHLRTHGGQNSKSPSRKYQRFYCHICVPAQRFPSCSELTEHRRLLHKDFECSICRGWFSCQESLESHLKTHSNKERKYSCKMCESTFTRASHLEGHMRRKHSADPKPIRCDLCDYRCVEPYELTGHKRHAHTKIKPYKCSHCEKSFSHGQAYKGHILTSHKIGEYRYVCSYCPKRFTNSAALIHHRGVHHNGAGN